MRRCGSGSRRATARCRRWDRRGADGARWHRVGRPRAAELAMDTVRRDLESALPPKGILAGTFYGRLGGETPDTSAVEFYTTGARPQILPTTESRQRAANGASSYNRQDPTAIGGTERVDLVVTPQSQTG